MPRTLNALIREMKRLTKGMPDAWKLARRFEARALAVDWDPEIPFDPDAGFHLEAEPASGEAPIVVMLLPEDAEAPADDALVWSRIIEYGEEETHALFVAAAPCHADWLALKALHEYGTVELQELVWSLAYQIARSRNMPLLGLDYQLQASVDHLHEYHEALIGRLIDRALRGAVTARVKTLKRATPAFVHDDEELAEALVNDMRKLLPRAWPKAANREERYARYDLMKCAARGLLYQSVRDGKLPQ